ncbi:MAG: glycosyltransferase family 2 protein [Verrucomicrobiaceae bacterium]|nr:MAG: glycosyltransferase family 2 protein [Verrucomicrobiaceae bacterium]
MIKVDIVIPTKGRHKDLLHGLSILHRETTKALPDDLEIGVCISDSSEKGLTEELLAADFPNGTVTYRHAPEIKRFVDNLKNAIFLSNAEYIWLMGDDDYICSDSLKHLNELLLESPSLVHVNAKLRINETEKELFLIPVANDATKIGFDIPSERTAEELAYMSCLIFKREIAQHEITWKNIHNCETASHLRLVCDAVAAGTTITSDRPMIVIEKNVEVVAEWNGNWCVLLGYEMPLARHRFIFSNSDNLPRRIKPRNTGKILQELRMHIILCVFRSSFPSLANQAREFYHETPGVRKIKTAIYIATNSRIVRQLLQRLGRLLDHRCINLKI